ncbi:MAG: TolB-like protein/tetratricopeptide (TPR) repeat protein [Arenicella sp.]
MENLLNQLKQRQIFKVATIYVVSAWTLIQIADIAVQAFSLPDTVIPLLFKVFVIGFPISLIFAWLINFTSRGLVRADPSNTDEIKAGSVYKTNLRAFVTVGGSLVVALLLTLGSQLLVETPEISSQQSNAPSAPQDLELAGLLNNDKRESIAVLPFEVFSDDPEDEFFVDGMVEELLNLLAKIPELKVAARTSSFSYKGVKDKTAIEIGKELGVDTLLEGSIRKDTATNRIRVTAQLINAVTGVHFWSEVYDREYLDIFQIQDEIANSVAGKMEATLVGEKPSVNFAAGTHNVDAMVEYGKGQKELGHRTVPAIEKALQHFQTAVIHDQNYARAYVGISDANILLALYGSLPRQDARATAQKALDTALRLDSQLGGAHASQGLLLSESNKGELAEASFKRAIELSPNYAMAYMWYGSLLRTRGDQAAAHSLFEKAYELDPKSPIAAFNVAWGHYLNGDEDEAMEWFSKIVANDPYYPGAYLLVGDILNNRGRLDESIDMYQRALKVDPLNKNAVMGLLFATMDMEYYDGTNHWLAYLEQNPSIMNTNETQFVQVRYLDAKGEHEQASKLMKDYEFSSEQKGYRLFVEAERAFYQQDYASAAKFYEDLQAADAASHSFFFNISDGQAAVHLSYTYQQLGQTNKASALILEFDKFLQSGKNKKANRPQYYYNMALVHTLRGNQTESFNYLQGAIDAGWVQAWQAKLEPIFVGMAKQARFGQMMGGISARLAYMRNRLKDKESSILAEG